MSGVVVGRCSCGGYGVVHDEKAKRETGLCHAPMPSASEVMQDDMRELLEALGRPSRIARDLSPHEVMQREIIPTVRDRSTRARFLVADIQHYLSEPDRVPLVAQRLLTRAVQELCVQEHGSQRIERDYLCNTCGDMHPLSDDCPKDPSAPTTAREELREQIAVAVADECALSIPDERGFAFAAADRILALLSLPPAAQEIERLRAENERLREAAALLDRVEVGESRGWALADIDLFLPGPEYESWAAEVRANRRARRALTQEARNGR